MRKSGVEEPPPASSPFPIDFVYCWAGEQVQMDGWPGGKKMDGDNFDMDHSDHNTGGGFGEMRWSLRYLEAYAPWFNKVYLLVNTPALRPAWLTERAREKIMVVDRCSLFPEHEKQNCPTLNSHACQAVMHKIPGLSEHFVAMQDDFLIHKAASAATFFTFDGKPNVLVEHANDQADVYAGHIRSGPDQPPNMRPTRMRDYRHFPIPMLVSFAEEMEKKYPDWYAFVRSHSTGRFNCCDKTDTSDGGLDEDFQRIYPHMLLSEGKGHEASADSKFAATCNFPVPDPVNAGKMLVPSQGIGKPANREMALQNCVVDMVQNDHKFMVLQNIVRKKTWVTVEHALAKKLQDDKVEDSRLLNMADPEAGKEQELSSLVNLEDVSAAVEFIFAVDR